MCVRKKKSKIKMAWTAKGDDCFIPLPHTYDGFTVGCVHSATQDLRCRFRRTILPGLPPRWTRFDVHAHRTYWTAHFTVWFAGGFRAGWTFWYTLWTCLSPFASLTACDLPPSSTLKLRLNNTRCLPPVHSTRTTPTIALPTRSSQHPATIRVCRFLCPTFGMVRFTSLRTLYACCRLAAHTFPVVGCCAFGCWHYTWHAVRRRWTVISFHPLCLRRLLFLAAFYNFILPLLIRVASIVWHAWTL